MMFGCEEVATEGGVVGSYIPWGDEGTSPKYKAECSCDLLLVVEWDVDADAAIEAAYIESGEEGTSPKTKAKCH